MIARRKFLQTAAIATAASWLPRAALGATLANHPMIAICDTSHLAGNTFALNARRMNLTVAESRGDVGVLWHETILPMLKQKPHHLVGCTLPSDLFVLELLTADSGKTLASVHKNPGVVSGKLIAWAIADHAIVSAPCFADVCNTLQGA